MLTNGEKLSESKAEHLQAILQDHHDLAVCYAMKEEMCRLYTLTNFTQALDGWTKWFEAAKESKIPALVKFAEQKDKRLLGLAAHAIYPIIPVNLKASTTRSRLPNELATIFRENI